MIMLTSSMNLNLNMIFKVFTVYLELLTLLLVLSVKRYSMYYIQWFLVLSIVTTW